MPRRRRYSSDGSVWVYTGAPCIGIAGGPGWVEIDDNAAAAIQAGTSSVEELRQNREIYHYAGQACDGTVCDGWQEIDDAVGIAAGGLNMFELCRDGTIWESPYSAALQVCTAPDSRPPWIQLPGSSQVIAMAAGRLGRLPHG